MISCLNWINTDHLLSNDQIGDVAAEALDQRSAAQSEHFFKNGLYVENNNDDILPHSLYILWILDILQAPVTT